MVARPDNYPQEPAQLWEHFFQISQIPRPSGEEAALRDHIIDLANSCACPSRIDTAGNLLVSVPGSVGRELEGSVIVQNHLDMVTVKTADSDHDFSADPLSLQVVDGWLSADRTTLGADNGLGCAAALALMTDSTVSHPPAGIVVYGGGGDRPVRRHRSRSRSTPGRAHAESGYGRLGRTFCRLRGWAGLDTAPRSAAGSGY